jgi:hypothetical protein
MPPPFLLSRGESSCGIRSDGQSIDDLLQLYQFYVINFVIMLRQIT